MRRIRLSILVFLSISCTSDKESGETGSSTPPEDTEQVIDTDEVGEGDEDEDGFVESEDCDDSDPEVNPDALELCDGIDNDCDGEVDEDDAEDATSWYLDSDDDGYGDEAVSLIQCEAPSGYVAQSKAGFDCDDADAAYNPGADEDDCTDPNDYNCDGSVAYEDADEDGWPACEDCNDSDASVSPDASEVCDEIDNDCDDQIDDEDDSLDSATATDWYEDFDEDGYGNEEESQRLCAAPSGYVEESPEGFDCDDSDEDYHPGADEDDCSDSNDYNCDGSVAYEDADGDGWAACEDCDDSDAEIHPDATEICNELDDDCDDDIDDDDSGVTDTTTWYIDHDDDGFGSDDYTQDTCEEPSGYATDATDCDDSNPDVNPDADEICNEIDDNCDGDIDDDDPDVTDTETWYIDIDGDGYGSDAYSATACEAPSGLVDNSSDCDDGDDDVNPDADEVCNEVDDDCDGDIDDDDDNVTDTETWYIDHDGDGYGSDDYTTEACEAASGWTDTRSDCDDNDAEVNPDADEACNEIDDDCDGDIDDDDSDLVDAVTWYVDKDGDGYGSDESTVGSCEAPSGWVEESSDCDDEDSDVNPDATETCNGIDDDCDGDIDSDDSSLDGSSSTTWYADKDEDGFGDADASIESCDEVSGYIEDDTDCDDADDSIHPDATETCDELDNDCDGDVDDDDSDLDGSTSTTWYADKDGDGFGDADASIESCDEVSGYIEDDTDCDDADDSIHPDAIETCNEIDDDCDGDIDGDDADLDSTALTTLYLDADSDGYGDPDTGIETCSDVSGYVEDATDCDDTDPSINPDGIEICDDEDNDCDGTVDSSSDILNIVVEGVSGDFEVCVTCARGDYSCQAEQICNDLTGETCQHQTYDCYYGSHGSWYPPSHGGSSNFNFAYDYDFSGSSYGNICDCIGVSSSYGIATNYPACGTGHWFRQ